MHANVGGMDRTIRIVGGLILIVLAGTQLIGPWGWIGLVPMITGLARSCLLYSVLGINTCPKPEK